MRPAADQRHRPLHVGGKQFQNAVPPPLADRSQAIEVGTAHHARTGAEGHRLDDVAAATDSAIADNLTTAANDICNLRHQLKARRGAVKLTAAVIWQLDRLDSRISGDPGIVYGLNSL